jgi:hypothetical protein
MTDPVSWVCERVPSGWCAGGVSPEVTVDREEILVVVPIGGDVDPKEFREQTRDDRVRLAQVAEERFGRKVSWGVQVGEDRYLFAHLAVPVMTRLRQAERTVLDTLIDAGVARSRSEALAWCVRLVDTHQGEWIKELRDALVHVEEVRRRGPGAT